MPDTIEAGNILIKEGTLLPETVRFETEPCVPGWRLVKGFDGYGLDREIRKTGWTFFCLAGEIKATVFGIDKQKMVRRAIERILAGPKSEKFNSVGITRVVFVVGTLSVCSLCDRIRPGATHSRKLVSPPGQGSSGAEKEKRAPEPKRKNCERRSAAFAGTDERIRCRIDRKSVIA